MQKGPLHSFVQRVFYRNSSDLPAERSACSGILCLLLLLCNLREQNALCVPAGALDGALLYLHKQIAAQPDVIPSEPLEKSWGVLWNNLARVLEVGQSSWAEAHVDDLHLLVERAHGRWELRHTPVRAWRGTA